MNSTNNRPVLVVHAGQGEADDAPDWFLPPVPRVRVVLETADWAALVHAARAGAEKIGEGWRERLEAALDEIELRYEAGDALWAQKVAAVFPQDDQ